MIDGTTRRVNAVTLGVEHFGDPSASLVLCIGGPTLLSWPDSLCAELARLGVLTGDVDRAATALAVV